VAARSVGRVAVAVGRWDGHGFVVEQTTAAGSVWSAKALVTELRSLLRFLHVDGVVRVCWSAGRGPQLLTQLAGLNTVTAPVGRIHLLSHLVVGRVDFSSCSSGAVGDESGFRKMVETVQVNVRWTGDTGALNCRSR
jgi:hypothetical protein